MLCCERKHLIGLLYITADLLVIESILLVLTLCMNKQIVVTVEIQSVERFSRYIRLAAGTRLLLTAVETASVNPKHNRQPRCRV